MRRSFLFVLIAFVSLTSSAFADTFTYNGRQRSYVVSAPRSSKPLGVFVLLHGNGGSGNTAVGRWTRIVHPDGVMCVGPNSINQASAWREQEHDGIDFIKALVKEVAKKYRIDGKRIYLGGYSAGACQSCRIGIPNSDYFAGIITYAGSSGQGLGPRKIPVALVHGDQDRAVDIDGTRRLHKMLKDAGWPVWYKEIPGQSHAYNGSYDREAWHWVKTHPPKDPPELIVKEKLAEGDAALEKQDYDKAYDAYKEALDTGLEKEKAESGIKKIEDAGRKEIANVIEKYIESPARAKRYLGKLKSRFRKTPVEGIIDDEIKKLQESEPEQERGKEKEENAQSPSMPAIEKKMDTDKSLMEKAKNYLRDGMNEAARQVLERLIDEFSTSPLAEEAKKKLEQLDR